MASPVADSYAVASGSPVHAGRFNTPMFDSVAVASDDGYGTAFGPTPHIMVFELHASGGQNYTTGKQFRGVTNGRLSPGAGYTEFAWSLARSSKSGVLLLRPNDKFGNYPGNGQIRQSMWLGFKNIGSPQVRLSTKLCLDALVEWNKAHNGATYDLSKMCGTGVSMGGWGIGAYGPRNPDVFAAIYPVLPRWRYDAAVGNVAVANWDTLVESVPVASAPNLEAADGGGSYAAYLDMVAYAANPANKLPPILWCIGRNDGYSPFSDHVAMAAALRSRKAFFVFGWNDGNHTVGADPMVDILASYPYGTFQIGKGMPYFSEHSLDQDPAVDLAGGINIGLSFRNVIETASGWSCEVTSVRSACTVNVEPISDIFTAPVAAKLVTIPAANTWVAVSFTA